MNQISRLNRRSCPLLNRLSGGFVGLALFGALSLVACSESESPPEVNVLVVTLDTTRADHLGTYGHPAGHTPNFDALAEEGIVFENAHTAIPITTPSHSTIFTGTYPPRHGVRDNGLFSLPDAAVTLAEILAEAGWDTGAAVGSVPVTRQFGLDQGFAFFDDEITLGVEDARGRRLEAAKGLFFDERDAGRVNDAFLPWLRRERDRPFFGWIHYWDAHHPHIPPAPFDQLYADDLYLGEIAYVDQNFGVVVEALRAAGEWDRTLVVVVADHGEGNGEHGEDTHSMLLYEGTLRVPLIVRLPSALGLPDAAGRRVVQRVGTVDIVPTVLEALGLPVPDAVQGRSLLGTLESDDPVRRDARTVYYAETLSPRLSYGWGELRALYSGPHKYIHGPRPELFGLPGDPRELSDLAPGRPEEAERLEAALQSTIEDLGRGAEDAVHELDAETRQKLEALGYVSSSGESPGAIQEILRSDGIPPQDRARDNAIVSRVKGRLREEDYSAALEEVQQLRELDPSSTFYLDLEARALLGLGQTNRAAALLLAVDDLGGGNDATLYETARRLYGEGSDDLARRAVEHGLTLRESANGRYLLAELDGLEGRTEESIANLRAALELDATHVPTRFALASRLAQNGDLDRALEMLRALVEERPLDAQGRYNYAVALLETDAIEPAREQLRRALELSPNYWNALYTLIAVEVRLGETETVEGLLRSLDDRGAPQSVRQRALRIANTLGAS